MILFKDGDRFFFLTHEDAKEWAETGLNTRVYKPLESYCTPLSGEPVVMLQVWHHVDASAPDDVLCADLLNALTIKDAFLRNSPAPEISPSDIFCN